jgi:polyisoprenoid-binding protein YceI
MRRTLLSAAIALSAATMLGGAPARAADYTIDPTHTHFLFM